MKQPLISVITVSYNAATTIEQTMLSVLNQTYPNVEYIVIDGGSTDGTVDIIKKYAHRLAYWVSEPDGGIYDAMNKGIAHASGDYINFMNAGDEFYKSSTLTDFFVGNHTEDILYGKTLNFLPYGSFIEEVRPLEEIRRQMCFCHQSSFVKTSLIKEIKFNSTYKSSGDYDFFYKVYHLNKTFCYIDQIVSKYNYFCGISKDNYKLAFRENLKVWGIEHSVKGEIWYLKTVLKIKAIKLLKLFIPSILLEKRRKRIISEMNNKYVC